MKIGAVQAIPMSVLFIAMDAAAVCRANSGSLPFLPRITYLTSPPTINADGPVGNTILATIRTYEQISGNTGITCAPSIGWYDDVPLGRSLGNSVYATNISGIGYMVAAGGNRYQPYSHYTAERAGSWPSGNREYYLVKTGPISSGGTLTGLGFTTYVRSHNSTIWRTNLPAFNVTVLTRPTCRLNNPARTIAFGQVPISATNGQLAQRNLPISVTCAGGSGGQTTRVQVNFTDANNRGNRGQRLSVMPADSGMALELRYNGSTINYSSGSPADGNWGRVLLGTLGNTTANYDLTAHLLRVGPMRGTTSFSAQAAITMLYE